MPGIINLTNFPATPPQVADGVSNVDNREELSSLLLFTEKPSPEDISDRAERIADIAKDSGADRAMISGAPYLMGALEDALKERGITPVYSFSERVSVEKQNPDGTVTKQNVFEHKGFIEAADSKSLSADKSQESDASSLSIINLTQHDATESQRSDSVVEPANKGEVRELLTFKGIPDKAEIADRAEKIADKAVESGCSIAMIGGAPYLMGPLERALESRGITPVYSYSERKVETTVDKTTGETKNTVTFEHKGFVEVPEHSSNVSKNDVSNDDSQDKQDDVESSNDEEDTYDSYDPVD